MRQGQSREYGRFVSTPYSSSSRITQYLRHNNRYNSLCTADTIFIEVTGQKSKLQSTVLLRKANKILKYNIVNFYLECNFDSFQKEIIFDTI